MKRGDLVTRWEALHRLRKKNYHIVDSRGRAVYCGCMPSIRHGNGYMSLTNNRRSKAYYLDQWYREYKFKSNLKRNTK